MRKDIDIPEVNDVFMAIVKEYNEIFNCFDWNAYVINNKQVALEMVLIVSNGFDKETRSKTSHIRHKIEKLPANSFAKVELIQPEVLKLDNIFSVTFFEGNTMFDKKYIFRKNTVTEDALRMIPLLNKKGVLIK